MSFFLKIPNSEMCVTTCAKCYCPSLRVQIRLCYQDQSVNGKRL